MRRGHSLMGTIHLLRAGAVATRGVRRRVNQKVAAAKPCRSRQNSFGGLSTLDLPSRNVDLAALELGSAGRRGFASASVVTFTAPPEELEDGYFERPTPLLLVAGESQPAAWWGRTASFFATRGCTVGTMALTGRGSSSTETLTLRALQAGVAAAVDNSGLTPPVIVAHSMAGFVCQQYLQSYSASGLVLLDSFPPSPDVLASEHLSLARAADASYSDESAKPPVDLSVKELAQLIKDNPARWEGLLERYFTNYHKNSPWQKLALPSTGDSIQEPPIVESRSSSEVSPELCPPRCRFPAKAFAQMCLGLPSSSVRLERHAVETLVLGSENARVASSRGSGLIAVETAKKDGLRAILDFHGVDDWRLVDGQGYVEGPGGKAPWQEEVWDWYDARF